MATGPIETHIHRSFNWENGAPGPQEGPRGRSANCGNGLSAQCVRLRSEINQFESNGNPIAQARRPLVVPSPDELGRPLVEQPVERLINGLPHQIHYVLAQRLLVDRYEVRRHGPCPLRL